MAFTYLTQRVLGLYALGWPYREIADHLNSRGRGVVSAAEVGKILTGVQLSSKVGPIGAALIYVEEILPTHVILGSGPAGTLLAKWRAKAEEYRVLLEDGVTPRQLELALLLTDRATCDLPYDQWGEYMTSPGRRPGAATIDSYLKGMWEKLGDHAGPVKLAVVCKLAPLRRES